jgi:hypothetical protein
MSDEKMRERVEELLEPNEKARRVPLDGRYWVTDQGRVISGARGEPQLATVHEKANGYLYVGLGQSKREYVHRLVLLAFVGDPESGEECRHLNGDRTDNRLTNLEWGTRKRNNLDKRRHGTNGGVLNEKGVLKMRELYWTTELSQYDLAKMFGCSQPQVSKVIRGEDWDHLPLRPHRQLIARKLKRLRDHLKRKGAA